MLHVIKAEHNYFQIISIEDVEVKVTEGEMKQ